MKTVSYSINWKMLSVWRDEVEIWSNDFGTKEVGSHSRVFTLWPRFLLRSLWDWIRYPKEIRNPYWHIEQWSKKYPEAFAADDWLERYSNYAQEGSLIRLNPKLLA